MTGPGKYDAECTAAREAAGAVGCALMVFFGRHGTGFSVAAPQEVLECMPQMLRFMADEIERDMQRNPQRALAG